MANFYVRAWKRDAETGEQQPLGTLKVPLPIVHIVARHLPDRILRLVDQAPNPQQTLRINPKQIMRMIDDVLREIDTNRSRIESEEVIFELELRQQPAELWSPDVRSELELIKEMRRIDSPMADDIAKQLNERLARQKEVGSRNNDHTLLIVCSVE